MIIQPKWVAEASLEKSQISWSNKLQEMSRKFRVKFPGQKLL